MITLYFLQAGMDGPIKIGGTKLAIEKRLSAIQNGCPYKIRILLTVEGTRTQERALHRAFENDRSHGEWFLASDRLLSTIGKIAASGFNWAPFLSLVMHRGSGGNGTALEKAIILAGGKGALARRIGVKPQAVDQWCMCPDEHAIEVFRASGVPLHELRSDLYNRKMSDAIQREAAE
jgi:DNA-binding transcriptional regulator YdaS (Cro superfamily)